MEAKGREIPFTVFFVYMSFFTLRMMRYTHAVGFEDTI